MKVGFASKLGSAKVGFVSKLSPTEIGFSLERSPSERNAIWKPRLAETGIAGKSGSGKIGSRKNKEMEFVPMLRAVLRQCLLKFDLVFLGICRMENAQVFFSTWAAMPTTDIMMLAPNHASILLDTFARRYFHNVQQSMAS